VSEAQTIAVKFKRYMEGNQFSAWMYVYILPEQSEVFATWAEMQEQIGRIDGLASDDAARRITFKVFAKPSELEAAIQAVLTSLETLLDCPLAVDDQGTASPVSHDLRFRSWIDDADFLRGDPDLIEYDIRDS
jgi:hypothetical protein